MKFAQFSIDNSSDAILWINSDGSFFYVNEAACKALGHSKEELLTKTIFDIDLHFNQTQWTERWKILKKKEASIMESRFVTKQGYTYEVEISGKYMEYCGTEYVCAFVRDITERKKAEKALKESETKYRIIAENTNDVIWLLDLETMRPTYVSPSQQKLTGYTVDEHLKRSIEDIITPEFMNILMERLEKALKQDAYREDDDDITDRLEWREYHKDGHLIWVEADTKFLRDDEGKPIGIIGVSRDISKRKRDEEKIKILSGMLPICSACKKIRNDEGYWKQIEGYIMEHSEAEFTHSICPECSRKLYPDVYDD